MDRRTFVALAGLTVGGLAGCTTGGADPDGSGPETDRTRSADGSGRTSPTRSTETAAGIDVTVSGLQPGVVTMTAPDSIGVQTDSGSQYLFLDLAASGPDAPAREAVAVRAGGSGYQPMLETRLWKAREDQDDRYDAGAGSGWLVFEIPAVVDPDSLALTWPGGSVPAADWAIDEVPALDRRLQRSPPDLSLEWLPPESVTVGEEPVHTFSVTNEADRPTRFVAAVNRIGPAVAIAPIARISHLIPAGQSDTWSLTDTLDVSSVGTAAVGDGEPDMTYTLDSVAGEREAELPVAGPLPTTDGRTGGGAG